MVALQEHRVRIAPFIPSFGGDIASVGEPLFVQLAPSLLIHRAHWHSFPLPGPGILYRTLEDAGVEPLFGDRIVRRIGHAFSVHEIVGACVNCLSASGKQCPYELGGNLPRYDQSDRSTE